VTHFYWDASALIKRYAPETGTDIVNRLFSTVALDRMLCLAINTGEVISVFVRKRNDGTITQGDFSQALMEFRAEVLDSDDFKVVSVDDALIMESHSLIDRHNLNATDALILRSALDIADELQPEGDSLILMTADRRLFRAAGSEGLRALNPEDTSMEDIAYFEGREEGGETQVQ
jgi:predicted nucleic acid-binding protein